MITGRRRSQGADRADLKVLEVDERGLVKVNPLIGWDFKQVKAYIDQEWVHHFIAAVLGCSRWGEQGSERRSRTLLHSATGRGRLIVVVRLCSGFSRCRLEWGVWQHSLLGRE